MQIVLVSFAQVGFERSVSIYGAQNVEKLHLKIPKNKRSNLFKRDHFWEESSSNENCSTARHRFYKTLLLFFVFNVLIL